MRAFLNGPTAGTMMVLASGCRRNILSARDLARRKIAAQSRLRHTFMDLDGEDVPAPSARRGGELA